MSTVAETVAFHRAAVAFHLAEIARLEGTAMPSDFDVNNPATWWPSILKQIADGRQPHAWVDLAPGTGGQAGDNDAPDDELFRTHGPFMEAAKNLGWKDSTGQRFTIQTVKKRANEIVGFGKPAWDYVRGEVRRLQLTPEGYTWCNDAANIAAGIVPKSLP